MLDYPFSNFSFNQSTNLLALHLKYIQNKTTLRPFCCQGPFLRANISLMDYCSHLFAYFFQSLEQSLSNSSITPTKPHLLTQAFPDQPTWNHPQQSLTPLPVLFFPWHQSYYFKAHNRALLPLRHGPWSSLDKSYDKKEQMR